MGWGWDGVGDWGKTYFVQRGDVAALNVRLALELGFPFGLEGLVGESAGGVEVGICVGGAGRGGVEGLETVGHVGWVGLGGGGGGGDGKGWDGGGLDGWCW